MTVGGVPYRQRGATSGYRYQDLVAALAMARVLAEGAGAVAVEEKRFSGDAIDDLELVPASGSVYRGQVKHREGREPLTLAFFKSDANGLRLDKLIAAESSYGEAGSVPDLRVVTTLDASAAAEAGFLRDEETPSFLPGLGSTCWRISVDAVWPEGDDQPQFTFEQDFTREALASFCRRLVVEADALPMSGTLAQPGELERALIERLREAVGVEQYPNRAKAIDVASRLLEIAYSLRTRKMRRLDFDSIAAECGLRVDRGRIAQAFPLDRRRYVPSVPLRAALVEALDPRHDHRRIIVKGPPGAGKSWALEALAQELRAEGAVVARHYCFLAPGDPDVAQRVAVDALIANLTAELLDDDRLNEVDVGLGAGVSTLERALARADEAMTEAGLTDRIVLFVDGLDHAARIEPAPGVVAARPEDLTAQLGLLELPDRVTLIVGSQPGVHLDTLIARGAHGVTVPRLELRHTAALLARQGTLRALKLYGFADDHEQTVEAVHEKAAGNPLLAGFLGREVVERLRAGMPETPSEAVAAIDAPDGDLEAYYRHLVATAEHASDGGILAEHLALLDFAVTEAELDKIVPAFGPARISRVVSALRPILDDVGTQGGLRIHHESFRRFIVENLIADGRRLGPLLDPVIAWLDARGLYKDQRAFRHLLSLLRRAGRADEILDRVGPEFVSNSVAELQPQEAIDANLRLAADVAAERQDFPALTRVAELRSAAITTFDEKLSDPTFWAEAVAELEGPQRVAERLLYDGRPTWPKATGLRLCAIVDRAGATPPWREYLAMRRPPDNVSKSSEQVQRETLDHVRGMLRTFERADSIGRLAAWIEDSNAIEWAYVDGIAAELASTLGPAGIVETLAAAPEASAVARAALELGLAEAYVAAGETDRVIAAGRRALAVDLNAEVMRRLLDIGLPADELTVPAPDLSPSGLMSGGGPDADRVESFLSWVFVAAARGEDLAGVRGALVGEGFYPAWLRFCCDLAEAVNGRAEVVSALGELARYDEPFAGSPRACDLYPIWSLTAETFRRAIALVSDDEWPRALELLLTISGNTTTSLQNHPSGPLMFWKLLELLQPYADRFPLDPVREAVEHTYRTEFYELHAEYSLRVALFEHRAGQGGGTDEPLATAGRYLAAYGFHKDVTVFGLVEALDAISGEAHRTEVTARFQQAFPLCDRAYRHSDGKETNHATYACFSAFASHTPGAATDALARTFLEDPPVRYRDSERGLVAVARTAPDGVPALLRHLLWRCCSPAEVKGWLVAVEALAAVDDARAREAFLELAAAVDGDTEHADGLSAELVRAFAVDHGWPEPPVDAVPDRRSRPDSYDYQGGDDKNETATSGPFFEGVNTELKLLVRFRGRFGTYDEILDVDALADELVARLRAVTGGDSAAVVGLVAAFCHEQRFLRQRGAILARVAAAFESDAAVAAQLYVLAWIGTGDGWDPFGGLEHRDLLESGLALGADVALGRLATEFGRHIQVHGTMGMTRRIVEAMVVAGDPDSGLACWDQAAAVVEHRLPVTAPEGQPTIAEPGDDLGDSDTERAYARLLGSLVHSSDPERRAAAIAGIAELLGLDHGLAAEAVTSVLSADATFTDTLLGIRILELAAKPEELGDIAEWLPGVAAAPGFGLQESAGALLDRLGEDEPASVVQLPGSERVVTQSDVAKSQMWDSRHRIVRLAGMWQPFERLVAGRYRDLRDAPGTDSIIKRQADTQFSRSVPWMPPWELHRWEAELLEVAVHDSVPELISHMGASGRWPPGMSAKLNAMLLPDVGAAAARARSRALRPGGVALPADRSAAIGPPVRVIDGAYEGWTRVALVEEEIQVSDEMRSSGTLTRVASGLWVGEEPPPDEVPFDTVLMEWRWHDAVTAAVLNAAPTGPVTAYGEEHHLVLFDSLLTLTPDWKARLGLRPAPLPAPLDLIDERGEVGAVTRCWRMRPYSYDYSPLRPMIRGAELLLRPDLAEAAMAAANDALSEITVVTADELRRDT